MPLVTPSARCTPTSSDSGGVSAFSFVFHPTAGTRSRYPHDSGVAWAKRYKNHNDLHPCA